jgi:hypothetical protein
MEQHGHDEGDNVVGIAYQCNATTRFAYSGTG